MSEAATRPAAPVSLADAKVGDTVIVVSSGTPRAEAVASAGRRRLKVGRRWYDRTGPCMSAHVPGTAMTHLVEPSPHWLERLAAVAEVAAKAAREQRNDKDEARLNRRVAADWLAHQTDPDEIERRLFNHTLDDVFLVLKQAGVV